MSYAWLSLSTIEKALPFAEQRGVSAVARSPIGFFSAYKKARGVPFSDNSPNAFWSRKRDAFIRRHMAQVNLRREPLWEKDKAGNSRPTRRHLALIVWAYSPTPERLERWLKVRSGMAAKGYLQNEGEEKKESSFLGGWGLPLLAATTLGVGGFFAFRKWRASTTPPPEAPPITAPPTPYQGQKLSQAFLDAEKNRVNGIATLAPNTLKSSLNVSLLSSDGISQNKSVSKLPTSGVVFFSQFSISNETISARSVLDGIRRDAGPLLSRKSQTIFLNVWQDVYDFANLMQLLLMQSLNPKKEGAEYTALLRAFFLRNRFVVRPDTDIYKDQKAALDYLTPDNGRDVTDAAIYVRGSSWEGSIDNSNDYNKKTVDYIKHLGCIPQKYPSLSSEARAKVPALLEDGLLLIFEHSLAKFANSFAILSSNPQAAKGVEAKLIQGAAPLASAGVTAALAAAGIGAAVPVVGWVAAAGAALVAIATAIFDVIGSFNRREDAHLQWQRLIQEAADDLWVNGLKRPPLRVSLLGYALNLISYDPSYREADSRARQPWLRNFCLLRGEPWGSPCHYRYFPQIPYFVRQIPKGLVIGFSIQSDDLIAINSTRAWLSPDRRPMMGWNFHDIPFEKIVLNMGFLGVTSEG